MKQTKHTPGPWTVDEEIEAIYVVIRNANRDPVALGYLSGWDKKTARANAHLIAVAPELLEVLVDLVSEVDGPDGSPLTTGEKMALVKCRAAIAKTDV